MLTNYPVEAPLCHVYNHKDNSVRYLPRHIKIHPINIMYNRLRCIMDTFLFTRNSNWALNWRPSCTLASTKIPKFMRGLLKSIKILNVSVYIYVYYSNNS